MNATFLHRITNMSGLRKYVTGAMTVLGAALLLGVGSGLSLSESSVNSSDNTVVQPSRTTSLGAASDVRVEASVPVERRVRQATAFTDCCVTCEEQTLEALVPTPTGPQRKETDQGLPLRRQFCGKANRYGVNDETADPRDIMINILPSSISPNPDFVAGFVNTEETPLKGNDLLRFGPVPPFNTTSHWNLANCLARAKEIPNKVIHAEITPDQEFYGQDVRFLPIRGSGNCSDGWDCASELEPGGGRSGTDLCVYGVYAIDHGSHSASRHTLLCGSLDPSHDRPEIHPFDAIWWRHPEANGWMFAVFQDDSNRYSFPHCDDDHNGNEWSQAPRDLTFRFPFQFSRQNTPRQFVLQHVRTRNFNGSQSIIQPKNVMTSALVNTTSQTTSLVIGGQTLLQVVKEGGTERETLVQVEGRLVKNMVTGHIILRVAVGCDQRNTNCVKPTGPRDHRTPLFNRLRQENGRVVYDNDDPGAGYYYAELILR
jgi:hypothetical protein